MLERQRETGVRYLASMFRCSLLSNIPNRLRSVLKCFLVAVVTVLMTAPSKSEGLEELRLLEMKWSCLSQREQKKKEGHFFKSNPVRNGSFYYMQE